MKKIVVSLALLLFTFAAYSQPKEVTLVVTGEGATKEEATNNALRSAVEQAFGVFVSANTEIFNDELIKDEIATISSGNIKSFKEIAYLENPSGSKSVSLQVVVSIGKLIKYSKSHGSRAEFAGAAFGANLTLYEFNKKAAHTALEGLYKELDVIAPSMYDYDIKLDDPIIEGDLIKAKMIISVLANNNTSQVGDYYLKTLESMSYSENEILPFLKMGEKFSLYYLYSLNPKAPSFNAVLDMKEIGHRSNPAEAFLYSDTKSKPFKEMSYFYVPIDKEKVNRFFLLALGDFIIKDNNGNIHQFNMTSTSWDEALLEHSGFYSYFNGYGEFEFSRQAITGIYSPIIKGTGTVDYVFQREYKQNGKFEGIILSNTSYRPGENIGNIIGEIKLDKETINTISSFHIEHLK